MSEPIQLVTAKTDKDTAEEIRAEIIESSKAYLAVVTKAHRAGFHVQVAMGPNSFNEVVIQGLVIAKHF